MTTRTCNVCGSTIELPENRPKFFCPKCKKIRNVNGTPKFSLTPHNEATTLGNTIMKMREFEEPNSLLRKPQFLRSYSVGTPIEKSRKRGRDDESNSNDDLSLIQKKSRVENISCLTLFVPFEAAIQHYKRTSAKGTTQKSLVTNSSGNYFDLSSAKTSGFKSEFEVAVEKQKAFDDAEMTEAPSTYIDKDQMAAQYHDIIAEHLNEFRHGMLPEIFFLSEQIKGQLFPDSFDFSSTLKAKYEKIGSTEESILPVNQISAYALKNTEYVYTVRNITRNVVFKTDNPTEHWVCVTKSRTDNKSICFTIAGVHLTSKYTSVSSSMDVSTILTDVGNFAAKNQIDALMGDFNLNTTSTSGGNFINSADIQLVFGNYARTVKISRSSSNNEASYMGGMIINPKVICPPIGLTFTATRMLGRTVNGEFYSDHQAIVGNYLKNYSD